MLRRGVGGLVGVLERDGMGFGDGSGDEGKRGVSGVGATRRGVKREREKDGEGEKREKEMEERVGFLGREIIPRCWV
jgi:hypothetical protein